MPARTTANLPGVLHMILLVPRGTAARGTAARLTATGALATMKANPPHRRMWRNWQTR